MHDHHTTSGNVLEFGIADRTLGKVDVGSPPVRSPSGTPNVSAITRATEIIKDGRISAPEQTAYDKSSAVQEAVRSESTRLAEAVRQAEGNDYRRDAKGDLKLLNGAPIPNAHDYTEGSTAASARGADPDTKHETLIKELGEGGNADEIQSRLDTKKEDKVELGVAELVADRRTRLTNEGKVVDVIVDKTAYLGTLRAEKADLKATGSADAANDFKNLKREAIPHLEQFLANDGQIYGGSGAGLDDDLVGDDWDSTGASPEDAVRQFDKLATKFYENPELLDGLVGHQGNSNRAIDDMEAHMEGIEDGDLKDKIGNRTEAAQELKGIFERYNKAKDSTDASSGRLAKLTAEIGVTQDSIKGDDAVLSSVSRRALNDRLARTAGIILVPAPARDEAGDEAGATGTPTPTDPTIRGGKRQLEGSSLDAGVPPNNNAPAENDAPAENNAPAEDGADTPPTNDDVQTGENTPPGETPPATEDVQIDYSTPAGQKTVLAKAREQELVPAENTAFDASGQAVYTVQEGDSYWRISDMSDGQPPHAFDTQHFLKTLNTNSERLGRDPQVGIIHPDEQIVIPNRSVEELVKLLQLPTMETAEADEEG